MSFRNRNLPARSDHESEYIAVLNEILITPQWWLGLRDEAIVSKWKANSRAKTSQAKLASMLSHSKKVPAYYLDRENEQLTHTAEFLIQELQYIAKHQLIPQRIYTTNNEPRCLYF
ncbi:hypothetical protein BCR33DRAFT_714993 [Rhizoclosmatium globosum]|uniref:Uncharacterized protein n=1 Tax=Rhizoclosmatium globosum TaxID=329046 RepID=A0A1Y2CJM5_9FUNG|nr:hypothetical protein BCR33DRAFT_714993 [Rhizoclosmatium globosum]|eukprot:ORY47231.1 hypothetical protein BCR33DRAFT_714993 [Rhizoclosmatium globosum]